MSCDIDRPVFDRRARRVLAEEVVSLPVVRRPDGSGHEAAATVRTAIAQDPVHAGRTECAFIRADTCFERVGWQSRVAVLAGGSEFQHGLSFCVERLANLSGAESLIRSRRPIQDSGGGEGGWCRNVEW